MKPAAKKSARKTAEKKERGNLKPTEIKPLVIAARKAFDFQQELGNLEPGETFDNWRKNQCLEAVGKPGITACSHDHYRPLMAHLQILAGRDEKAFQNLTTTGQASKQTGDTHEVRRILSDMILTKITDHLALAEMPWQEYLSEWFAESEQAWNTYQPGEPFPGLDRKLINDAFARRESIAANDGPIRQGYLIWITRQKTRRQDLQLGKDLAAALADRCTVKQLTEIRDTIVNRISAKEGVGHSTTRNRKQSSPHAKAARSPKNLDQPRW